MAKEAVPVAVAPACEQPNGVLPDFMDLPSSSMSHIPPEALARAFNLPQRRAEVPAYHPSWQWPAGGLDAALLMQQFQPASAYQAPGMMPMGAGLGGSAYPAYPYLGLNWLAMRDPAQIAMPPPSLPYYPCHMSAGAAQMPAAWPQRLPDKQAVLPGRVPPAVSPGWSAYPGGMPFPQGAACDMHGTPLQGLDYTGAGVHLFETLQKVLFGNCRIANLRSGQPESQSHVLNLIDSISNYPLHASNVAAAHLALGQPPKSSGFLEYQAGVCPS